VISVTVDSRDAEALLQRSIGAFGNTTSPFRVAATRLRADTLRNFREGGWFPQAWQPSRKASGRTLIRHSTLRGSFHADSGPGFARVGSDLLYAGIHQFGGIIRPRQPGGYLRFKVDGQFVSVRQVRIPARPMLPVDPAGNLHPDSIRFIVDAFERHIAGGES